LDKENKLFDQVIKRNPKLFEGKEDLVILYDWIRPMEKIFDLLKVPDWKCINIGGLLPH